MVRKKGVFSQRRYDTGMKFMDLGNWAAGALVFGQGVAGSNFDLRLVYIGLLAIICFYVVGWIMMRGGGSRK